MHLCSPVLLDDSFCKYLLSDKQRQRCPYKSMMIFSISFSLVISKEKSCFKGKISVFFFKFYFHKYVWNETNMLPQKITPPLTKSLLFKHWHNEKRRQWNYKNLLKFASLLLASHKTMPLHFHYRMNLCFQKRKLINGWGIGRRST